MHKKRQSIYKIFDFKFKTLFLKKNRDAVITSYTEGSHFSLFTYHLKRGIYTKTVIFKKRI